MYLDALQQVLSQSSKIIVEGKAGNMMYLPLDKLAARPDELKRDTDAVLNQSTQHKPDMENALLDGRETTRRTEPLGRSD